MLASAEEFERAYAERSGLTVQELRDLGRVVRPCDCGEEGCEGWQSASRELSEDSDFRSSDAKPSDQHTQREPAEDATGGTAGPGPAPD